MVGSRRYSAESEKLADAEGRYLSIGQRAGRGSDVVFETVEHLTGVGFVDIQFAVVRAHLAYFRIAYFGFYAHVAGERDIGGQSADCHGFFRGTSPESRAL